MPLNRTLSVEIRADVAPFEAGLRRAAEILAQLDAKITQAAGAGAKFGVIATELGDVAATGDRAGSSLLAMGEATGALAPLQGEITGVTSELRLVPTEAERASGALVGAGERGGAAFVTLGSEVRAATEMGLRGTEELAAAQGAVGRAAVVSAEELVAAYGRARLAQGELTVGTDRVLASQGQIGAAAIATAAEVERAAVAIAAAEGTVSAAFAREALAAKTTQAEVAAAILKTMDAEHLRDIQAQASAALSTDLAAKQAAAHQGAPAEEIGALGAAGSSEGGLLKGFRSTVGTIALFEVGIRAGEKFREMATEAFHGAQTIGVAVNQADTFFGQFASHVIHNTEQLGEKFGFSNAQMLLAADNVGRVGRQMGLTAQGSASLAIDLEPTIGAFARFKNLSIEEVSTNFSRSLGGNARSAKLLGVILDETHLKQAALALGIQGESKSWTDQETVMIRARTIHDQLGAVTDRLAQSQDTLAGRLATARGRVENWLETIGQAATPALLGFFDGLGDAIHRLSPFFTSLGETAGHAGEILGILADAFGPLVGALAALAGTAVIDTLNGIGAALSATTGFLADHRTLVEALAIAYAVSLAPAVIETTAALVSFAVENAGLALTKGAEQLRALAGSFLTILPAAEAAGLSGAAVGPKIAGGMVAADVAVGTTGTALATLTIEEEAAGLAGLGMGARISAGATGALAAVGRLQFGMGAYLAIVGAGAFVLLNRMQQAHSDAGSFVEKALGKVPTSGDLQPYRDFIEQAGALRKQLEHDAGGGARLDLGPVHLFSSDAAKQAQDRLDALNSQNKEAVKNEHTLTAAIEATARATGLSRDQVRTVAASLPDLDLSKGIAATTRALEGQVTAVAKDLRVPEDAVAGWQSLADAVHLTPDALVKVGQESGFTRQQLSDLAASGISDMEALGASVKGMQDTFAKGVSPLSLVSKFATPLDFTGLEAQKAAAEGAGKASEAGAGKSETANLSAKRAVDAHTAALHNLTRAQQVLDQARAKGNPASIANAENKVADAQNRVTTSSDAAAIAQGKAGDATHAAASKGEEWTLTAERIKEGYRNVLTNVQSFNTDMATLVSRGLNPQTLVELMNMEPQQAASIAKAILSDTSKTTIDTINIVSTAMNNLVVQHTRFSQLAAIAVKHADMPDAAQVAADMPLAQGVIALQQAKPGISNVEIAKQLGIDPQALARVSKEYVLGLANVEAEGLAAWQAANERDAAKWAEAAGQRNITNISQAHKGKADQPQFDEMEALARKVSSFKVQFPAANAADIEAMFGADPATLRRVSDAYMLGIDFISDAGGAALAKDQKALAEQSKAAAEGVAKDFGYNLGSKGEKVVTALADSIASAAPGAMAKAQRDLSAAFGQDKANAIVLDMMTRLRAAGNLVGAIQLQLLIDPQFRLMNYRLLDPQSDARFGPGGAHAGAPRALGGFDTRGDVRDGHAPEMGRVGVVPRMWLERETLGETYIPHAPDHRRPAAERYLAQTAELFGGRYVSPRDLTAHLDRDTVHLAEGGVLRDVIRERVVDRVQQPTASPTHGQRREGVRGRDLINRRTAEREATTLSVVRVDTSEHRHDVLHRTTDDVARQRLSFSAEVEGAAHAPTLRRFADPSPANLAARPGGQLRPGAGEGEALRAFALGGVERDDVAVRVRAPERTHRAVALSQVVHRGFDDGQEKQGAYVDRPRGAVRALAAVEDGAGAVNQISRRSHAPNVRAFALGGVEHGGSVLAGQGRASAASYSPRDGAPRVHVPRQGAPRVPDPAAFAGGGIVMRPSVPSNVGVDQQGYRLVASSALAQPGAAEAIAQRGAATFQRYFAAVKANQEAAAAAAAAAGGGGGGGAALGGDIQLIINAALGIAGYPADWFGALTTLVSRESGGNARAVNPISVGGEHATGLFQMLPSTFRSNMLPGYGDIFSPIDNAVSALRYIARRYGSPSRIPHLYDNAYVGYALGGVVREGDSRERLVVAPRTRAMVRDHPLGRVESRGRRRSRGWPTIEGHDGGARPTHGADRLVTPGHPSPPAHLYHAPGAGAAVHQRDHAAHATPLAFAEGLVSLAPVVPIPAQLGEQRGHGRRAGLGAAAGHLRPVEILERRLGERAAFPVGQRRVAGDEHRPRLVAETTHVDHHLVAHAATLRRGEVGVARRAQPDVRLAPRGVTPPATVGVVSGLDRPVEPLRPTFGERGDQALIGGRQRLQRPRQSGATGTRDSHVFAHPVSLRPASPRQVGHVGVEVGAAHAGRTAHLDRGHPPIGHEPVHRALGDVQRGGDLVGGQQQRGRRERDVAHHVVGVVARQAGHQRLPALRQRDVVTPQHPPMLLQGHPQVPLEVRVQPQRDHARIVEPRAPDHTLVTTRPGFAPRRRSAPRGAPVAGRVTPRASVRTHEPEGPLAPLAWIEVDTVHPEAADVHRGRIPVAPPRRIGPAFVSRLAPVVAERLARHETPSVVATDVAALHRVAHGVGLAARGRLPEAPLLAAEGGVVGSGLPHRREIVGATVPPTSEALTRHMVLGPLSQELVREVSGAHRLRRNEAQPSGIDEHGDGRRGRAAFHALSVGPLTAAGGALLASGRPRGTTGGVARAMPQFAVPSPSPTELRAVRRLIGPEARRINEDARLHPRTPAPVVPTQRDVSTLRELRVDRIERFDAGGLLRPGTTLALNATGRDERVVAAAVPAHLPSYPTHPVMTAPVVHIDARLNVGSISKAELRDVQRLLDSRVKPIEDAVVAGFRKLGS